MSAFEMDPTRTDIKWDGVTSFIVTGFFTPNYFPLAEAFSKNLRAHKISHHLYARERITGQWGHQTLQKPSVLKSARRDYPNQIIVLMDVDCRIRGDISPMLNVSGDIAVPMGRKPMKNGTALKPGTRVVLLRPTAQADALLELWEEKCDLNIHPVENDEIRLQMAIEDSNGRFAIATLNRHYTGMELRKATQADIIVHDSARDEARLFGSTRKEIKSRIKKIRNSLHFILTGQEYKSKSQG